MKCIKTLYFDKHCVSIEYLNMLTVQNFELTEMGKFSENYAFKIVCLS